MKIQLLIIIAALTLTVFSCSGRQITGKSAAEELQTAVEYIRKDKKNIYKLDDWFTGRKGYFYIIRNDGKISHHPEKALINFDFSRYQFIQKILKERNGCLSIFAEGVRRYIFYREIDGTEILCLTVDSEDFNDQVIDCDTNVEEKK